MYNENFNYKILADTIQHVAMCHTADAFADNGGLAKCNIIICSLTPLHCMELGWGPKWCKWTSPSSGCGWNSPQVPGVWLQTGEVASKWLRWVKSWVLYCNCLILDNSTMCVCQLYNIGYDDAIPLCFWGNAPANYGPVCSFLPHYMHYRWGRRCCRWNEGSGLRGL